MKRILSILLAVTMLLSMNMLNVSAAGNEKTGDTVSISFKVGDSTLSINGKDVEVEKPVVIGTGTTMVIFA